MTSAHAAFFLLDSLPGAFCADGVSARSENVDGVQSLGLAFAAVADWDLIAGLYETDGAQEAEGSFAKHPFHN